jgi:AcrR family transcriptional regulator
MVRAAAELFHRQGLGATSPDEIARAVGGETRLFYHYFKSKQGIVHEVLRYALKAIEAGAAPIKYDFHSWQDLNNWFMAHIELQRAFRMTRSCPCGTIAYGVTENDELIRQDLALIFDFMSTKLTAFFTQEKAEGRISEEINPTEMAYFCIAAVQGSLLMGKITRNIQPVESAIRVALACITGSAKRFRSIASHDQSLSPTPGAVPSIQWADRARIQATSVGARTPDARLRMIGVAADLFHKQGVGATTPDQIIQIAGTGKGQFYYYFKSKEGLVHEVLQQYLSKISSNSAYINFQVESWEDLQRWFSDHIRLQKQFGMTRGCPLGTIGNEITENDALMQQDLNLIFDVIRNKVAAFFIREKAKGLLSREANEDDMADFCLAVIQGAMLLAKVKRDVHVVEAVAEEAVAHLKREIVGVS